MKLSVSLSVLAAASTVIAYNPVILPGQVHYYKRTPQYDAPMPYGSGIAAPSGTGVSTVSPPSQTQDSGSESSSSSGSSSGDSGSTSSGSSSDSGSGSSGDTSSSGSGSTSSTGSSDPGSSETSSDPPPSTGPILTGAASKAAMSTAGILAGVAALFFAL